MWKTLVAALLLGPQTDKTRGTTHYVQLGSFQLAVNELKSKQTAIGGPAVGGFERTIWKKPTTRKLDENNMDSNETYGKTSYYILYPTEN